MNIRALVLPLAAAIFSAGPALAQQEACTCPRPGAIGVYFSWDGDADARARVAGLGRGGPAERAGIRPGDVVVSVEGAPATRAAVNALTERLQPGDTVRVRVDREGAQQDVVVIAGERGVTFARAVPGATYHTYHTPGERAEVVRLQRGDSAIVVYTDSLATRIDTLARTLRRMQVRVLEQSEAVNLQRMQLQAVEMERGAQLLERHLREGSTVHVRDGTQLGEGITITRGDALPHFLEIGARAAAGAELAELNEGLSRYFQVREGIVVLQVAPQTPAARAGLEAGDVVVAVGGTAVRTPRELRDALNRSETGAVRLDVVRQGQPRQLELEWQRPTTVRRAEPAQVP